MKRASQSGEFLPQVGAPALWQRTSGLAATKKAYKRNVFCGFSKRGHSIRIWEAVRAAAQHSDHAVNAHGLGRCDQTGGGV